MYFEVLPAKIFRKSPKLEDGILTYSCAENLKIGTIVEIPLGKKTTVGIIYRKVEKPDFDVKDIIRIVYDRPLPSHLLKSILWLSEYYLVPLPQVVSLFLPNTIEKRHKVASALDEKPIKTTIIPLNTPQKQALEALRSAKSPTKLLHGVTGSGKTNLYLTLSHEAFLAKKSTILLVPEIALTSQLVQIFKESFGENVVLIHSKQTDKVRRDTFESLLNSDSPKIVIGPRSALFAPLKNLGLIIVDEAHESTYFQDQTPKYSAIRLASFITKTRDISCILGTATPKVEDYYLAKTHNSLITLKEKAKETNQGSDEEVETKLEFKKNF